MMYVDNRHYPKMYLHLDMSVEYLTGIQDAMRFILSVDLQAVSLTAADAFDHAEELLQDKIISMEVDT